MAVFEPKISRQATNGFCRKLGFIGVCKKEAIGFKGGLWLLWKEGNVQVEIFLSYPLFVAAKVCTLNETNCF